MEFRFADLQFHNECNRKCWFCPPQCKNKPKKTLFMEEQTLLRIIDFIKYLDDNKMIDGTMSICTNRYNEPFCYPDLYIKYITIMSERLKDNNAVIGCNTNGDYLNRDIVEQIIKHIHHITISLYDLDLVEAVKFVGDIFKDSSKISNFFIKKETKEIIFEYKKVKVIIKFDRNKTIKDIVRSRGSILQTNYLRNEECSVIGNMFAVDLDGSISPCCDLYKDNIEHKNAFNYININEFNNKDLIEKIETTFLQFKNKTLCNNSCRHCSSTEENSMGKKIVLDDCGVL